ncbi:glutaredoxin 2 [Thiotrichales bacterium 19S11-10]|nr:glutaredoxin 2 [Thiotrichales bacterium 19S11-10]MCF6807119.1 glutaredoxin 2 [Thiotrichales bacterium 19S9-11]MCF6811088.1 glutaredoxin 2 [Thiotrichales bacterium 19S9-12]
MQLYHYEHCPYCIRVRVVLGVKNILMDLINLPYDDKETPINLTSRKTLPILVLDDGKAIDESLDICQYLDFIDDHPIIESQKASKEVKEKVNTLNDKIKPLVYPRAYLHPLNQYDFPTQSAVNYFRLPKEEKMGINFSEALIHSQAYLKEVLEILSNLEAYFEGRINDFDKKGILMSISYDDVIFFPVLRLLTLASDVLVMPEGISYYVNQLALASKVDLYQIVNYGVGVDLTS